VGEPGAAPVAASRNLRDVDIRIGIANSPRELNIESSQTSAEVEQIVASALESDSKFIKLSDEKGKLYIVPVASFSYLEMGGEESRRVGFFA
jgi:hypothetical protein